MTLAALFKPSSPIVISDVLLSHVGQPTVDVTPTGVFIRPHTGAKVYRPVGFSQKTLLLDDDRAVFTGAGKLTTLRSLAVDLRDRIKKGLRPADLEGWLASRSAICGKSTSAIVAWLDDHTYKVGKVGAGIRSLQDGDGEQVIACGSGSDWLRRNLITEDRLLDIQGEFTKLELRRFRAVSQVAQHLAQERFLGMRDAFGAGFQVVYFDGARFVPVPQITYLNFVIEHDASGPVRMLFSGPLVIQRSDGQRLAFELWAPEDEEFTAEGETMVLHTRNRRLEKVVPPLLHSRTELWKRSTLSVGNYVAAQTVHVRNGRLIGLGSFALIGDPALTGVALGGEPNDRLRLAIAIDVFETWMTRMTPVCRDGKPTLRELI
ncbi:hypothetical protein [Sphingomonas faeni]|uniref:hypothetical protein n=1 Tax=Sphingomonas faeni TaxID=185950 RepID=UPI003349483E